MISIGILSALFAVFAWVVYNVTSKKATMHLTVHALAVITIAVGIIPMIGALFVTGLHWPGNYNVILSIISGVFLCLGFIFYFRAVESQQLTNVVVFGELSPAILTLFGVFVLNETITKLEIISMMLIFGGALLVISTEGFKINTKLIPAVLASASWTVWWLILSEAVSNSSGFSVQIIIARATALIMIAIVAYPILRKKNGVIKSESEGISISQIIGLAAVVGIFDGLGDTTFAFTLSSNLVAVGGAITALTPMLVCVLSYFIFKDRLTRMQGIGFIIMVIGGLALSVG